MDDDFGRETCYTGRAVHCATNREQGLQRGSGNFPVAVKEKVDRPGNDINHKHSDSDDAPARNKHLVPPPLHPNRCSRGSTE